VRCGIIKQKDRRDKMVMTPVKCPVCKGTKISKNGTRENGTQRYLCNDKDCPGKSFILEYTYNGCKPGIDADIINMTANASGIRDISRVLRISKTKVSSTLKKLKMH
jgi:transposase-like protein